MNLRPSYRAVAAVCALLMCAWASCAQTREQQDKIARLEKEISILNRQIKDNTAKNADALTRLSLIQAKIRKRQSVISESDRKIAALDSGIKGKQREIDLQQARLDTMSIYYDRLVRTAYKNRDARVWYMYILSSENMTQGFRRYCYFRDLSKQMNSDAAAIKRSQADLADEKETLERLKSEVQALRSKQAAELKSLQSEERQVKSLSAKLRKDKTRYQKELASKKRQAEALEREIRKAINKARGGAGKPKNPVDYTLAGEFVANKGKLPWPAQGAVTSRFGKQSHSVFKNLQMPPNNGITMAVDPGTDACAVFDGTVAQITVLPGYHQCILVQHGNYFTLYAKIKTAYVKSGEKVRTGQRLGKVDTIAGETSFHFEIWDENTNPQDPERWLRPR